MKRKLLTLALILVLLIAAVIGGVMYWNSQKQSDVPAVDKPSFHFDAAKAPGWWSAGNNWPDAAAFTGNQIDKSEIPIADINVHHGTQSKPGNGCFVMAFYQKGSIDEAAVLQKREAGMTAARDKTDSLKQVATSTQTLSTYEGVKDYTLHQYNLDVPQVQKGNAFGFAPLSNGYIEVRAICPTAGLLPTVLPVLSVLSFRK